MSGSRLSSKCMPRDHDPNDPLSAPLTNVPIHRRYWGYYNRPYSGCGCLWSILLILLVWWLLSWMFGWGFGWWGSGPPAPR